MPSHRSAFFRAGKAVPLALAMASLLPAINVSDASIGTQSLHGTIKQAPLWEQYKDKFLARSGRIIDNANGNISHSEGQGFAMLMAVAADDRTAFEAMWKFTRSNLAVRHDSLLAWRWKPSFFGKVKDKNNATDGDILVAWALLEAAEAGFGDHYRKQANNMLRDIRKLIKPDSSFGLFLRPAAFGFDAHQHRGRDIINISYWVFPAFERFAELTGDRIWLNLNKSGEKLIRETSQNRAGLPSDWNTVKRHKGTVGTTGKLNDDFSYNAVRVPLYLAWSKAGSYRKLESLQKNWVHRSKKLERVDVRTNRASGQFLEQGYYAVAAVLNCSISGQSFPTKLRTKIDELYYPASLQLLSIIATKQRYPQCW